jgi:hypothetical protein
MWTPERVSRQHSRPSSVASIAGSLNRTSTFEEKPAIVKREELPRRDNEMFRNASSMWAPKKMEPTVHQHSRPDSVSSGSIAEEPEHPVQEYHRRDSTSTIDSMATDGTHSTLAFELDNIPQVVGEFADLKTPTNIPGGHHAPVHPPRDIILDTDMSPTREISPSAGGPLRTAGTDDSVHTLPPTIYNSRKDSYPQSAGPLERILRDLLPQIAHIEHSEPTVMASDYAALQNRVAALEAEKATWESRHSALYALRDEDVENLIKVRCMLADERRHHDALKLLREDDLQNNIALREKLAKATWSPTPPQRAHSNRSSTPSMSLPGGGQDLWQAAKTAAMEQRVLELEKHNAELRSQKAGGASPTADMGPEERIMLEHVVEDGLKYRERMGAKVQSLRSEKEALSKELHKMEDLNEELQAQVERLKRQIAA